MLAWSSTRMPPVGKSGPLTNFSRLRSCMLGFSISAMVAAHSSPRLCGGIEVAMPTAMPVEPLASRLGKAAGSTTGSFVFAVIGGAEIHRVLVQAVQQRLRGFGQAAFGVAHGGGVIAVDIAEIALPVDQRIAHGEILRQAHQRVIDRLVAMGMVFAHHIAHHVGGFLEAGGAGSSRSSRMPTGCGDARASAHRAHRAARAG